jgi:hypothetical protein
MYVYMCVCMYMWYVCVCVCVCIYTHAHTHISIHVHTTHKQNKYNVSMHEYTHACMQKRVHTYIILHIVNLLDCFNALLHTCTYHTFTTASHLLDCFHGLLHGNHRIRERPTGVEPKLLHQSLLSCLVVIRRSESSDVLDQILVHFPETLCVVFGLFQSAPVSLVVFHQRISFFLRFLASFDRVVGLTQQVLKNTHIRQLEINKNISKKTRHKEGLHHLYVLWQQLLEHVVHRLLAFFFGQFSCHV